MYPVPPNLDESCAIIACFRRLVAKQSAKRERENGRVLKENTAQKVCYKMPPITSWVLVYILSACHEKTLFDLWFLDSVCIF